MVRLTHDELRTRTLSRQFPDPTGTGGDDAYALLARFGPIQSQVPRAPFLTLSSRLPGIDHATITALFAEHRLLKTSNLRGTVHTSVRAQFGWLDAVARAGRAGQLRQQLQLSTVTPEAVMAEMAEIETYAGPEWRPRADLVAHLRKWLAEHNPAPGRDAPLDTFAANLVWGHSGLVRRPRDEHWEKRNDTLHRTARSVVPEVELPAFAPSLTELARIHLGAYGPATRDDLAYFFGVGLRVAEAAVAALGEEVVRLSGPDGEDYLDLAEPPASGTTDPGLRLLPEFDGLLLGYCRRHRTRFLTTEQLPVVWAKVNGVYAPTVLHDGRIVARWKTVTQGRRTSIEVSMLDPYPRLADDLFTTPVRAVELALGLTVTDLRVTGPLERPLG